MRGLTRPGRSRELIMNYIGSLGYYAWHFAWVLLLVQLLLQVSQYFVIGQRISVDMVATGAAVQPTGEIGGITLVGVILSSVLVIICTVLLPYYVGKISRRLPRFVIRETSWPLTLQNLLRLKLIANVVLVSVAIVCIFVPEGVSGSNLGFVVVVISAGMSGVCFSLQHQLATLWRVPERYLF